MNRHLLPVVALRIAVPAVAFCGLLPMPLLAEKKVEHTPTIDQSLEMHTIASAKISPDGRRVIYEQSRTDWERNTSLTQSAT